MVTFGVRLRVIFSMGLFLIIGIGLGFVMLSEPFSDLLTELSEVRGSDVIGVFGTTYALITAFILVNVWGHFNETNESISLENKALISLWNNTDYLNDPEVSESMYTALVGYIDHVTSSEIHDHIARRTVEFPVTPFIKILRVIDKVKFDDPRDPIIYEALVSSYKDLSESRNSRINQIHNRIPLMLKGFYIFASFIFWFGYLIEGFESDLLYMIVLVLVTIITVFAYAIIFDLDKTLDGLLQVDTSGYERSLSYIKSTEHQ